MNNKILAVSLGCWEAQGRPWTHAHALETIQEVASRGLSLKVTIVRHIVASTPLGPRPELKVGTGGRVVWHPSPAAARDGQGGGHSHCQLQMMFVEDRQVKHSLLGALEAAPPMSLPCREQRFPGDWREAEVLSVGEPQCCARPQPLPQGGRLSKDLPREVPSRAISSEA